MTTVDVKSFSKQFGLGDGWMFSVVCNENSYGGKDGLFEVGMWNKDNPALRQTKVQGFLSFDDVLDLVNQAHKNALETYVNKLDV